MLALRTLCGGSSASLAARKAHTPMLTRAQKRKAPGASPDVELDERQLARIRRALRARIIEARRQQSLDVFRYMIKSGRPLARHALFYCPEREGVCRLHLRVIVNDNEIRGFVTTPHGKINVTVQYVRQRLIRMWSVRPETGAFQTPWGPRPSAPLSYRPLWNWILPEVWAGVALCFLRRVARLGGASAVERLGLHPLYDPCVWRCVARFFNGWVVRALERTA
jgi:hypothetical protein